jgi:serine/threonine-protein kinase
VAPAQDPEAAEPREGRPVRPAAPRPSGAAQPPAAKPSVPADKSKPALPQAGETFAGRYRVEKYLGLGALCNAYLCRDLGNGNQEVVVKIMHARKASEAGLADSFLFLAESVAKYDHKGIAKIHDWGVHEGAPYYTMEWVGGIPLRLWLMERLNFENRVLPGLGIVAALLDTFEIIHERGCYGCVKPENVFITLNGPVIMDFGVVGFLSPQEFEFNTYARRYLPYMAPELRQDWSNLLPHSDYYSLGALLYEIMVGRAPAPQLRLPSELSRLFGIEADEIILKSMAAKPLDRFATVQAFKDAVLSLQSALLNAQAPSAPQGLPTAGRPAAAPRPAPHLQVASDAQTVHNPEEAFTVEDLPRPIQPAPQPARPEPPQSAPSPWARELAPAAKPEPGEKAHSAFARLEDRNAENAHSQRRFAHTPPALAPEGAVSPNAAPSEAWTDAVPKPESTSGLLPEEEEAEPVPAWLWILIALAGSGMVVLSAYFGLLHSN